jgi:hypothetical protein
MNSSRYRLLLYAGLLLVLVWGGVMGGYRIADALRPTPEKLASYATALDLSTLSPGERKAALERLAGLLNALDYEARREVRLGDDWRRLFEQMTDAEKAWFVEQTLPGGVRQMLDAFESLPEEKRRRAVEESVRRMREARATRPPGDVPAPTDAPVMSEEMQRQIVELGMKTFYSQSSAQTKAELAPVMEEMQRLMESGGLMRGRRR